MVVDMAKREPREADKDGGDWRGERGSRPRP